MGSLKLPKRRVVKTQASVSKRVLAFIFDVALFQLIILAPFNSIFLQMDTTIDFFSQTIPGWFYAVAFMVSVLSLLYFSLFEYYLGYSVGMYLLKLRIKGDLSLKNCFLRNLYALSFFPFTLLWLIEPIYLFVKKERLLDKWTKTSVYEEVVV